MSAPCTMSRRSRGPPADGPVGSYGQPIVTVIGVVPKPTSAFDRTRRHGLGAVTPSRVSTPVAGPWSVLAWTPGPPCSVRSISYRNGWPPHAATMCALPSACGVNVASMPL